MQDFIESPTTILYAKIVGLFLASVLVNRVIARTVAGRAKFIASFVLLLSALIAIHMKLYVTETRYSDFGVFRYAKTHEIKSRYRTVSKQAHPDIKQAGRDVSFEDLSDKLEFLTNRVKRELYDKYNKTYENREMDAKETKQLQSYLFQFEFYRLVNISFLWICVLFGLSTLTRSQKLVNNMLKFVVLKTFIQVFYVYTQPVEEKSIFDSVFPHLTIHLQVFYLEYFFSVFMGFVWSVLYDRYAVGVEADRVLIEHLSGSVEATKIKNEEVGNKLETELKQLKEVVYN